MMSAIYKTMKVFDCQWDPGMPEDVKDAFFDCNRDPSVGNDVFVEWTVQSDGFISDEGRNLVDDWLIANGAEPRSESSPYNGETVLIKHWW